MLMNIIGKIKNFIFGTRVNPVGQIHVPASPPPDQAQTGKIIDNKPHLPEIEALAVLQRAETVSHELNEALNLVTQTNNRLRRESKLRIVRERLVELKKLANTFSFLKLENLSAVENNIIAIESETNLLSYGEFVNTKIIKDADKADQPVPVRASKSAVPASYKIPPPLDTVTQNARWVPVGESVTIASFTISQGMIYFGNRLRSASDRFEPAAVIDPKLPVSACQIDEGLRLTDYWPSYGDIRPDARRAYLQWLAAGRCNPQANIGYVFLFFTGWKDGRFWMPNMTKRRAPKFRPSWRRYGACSKYMEKIAALFSVMRPAFWNMFGSALKAYPSCIKTSLPPKRKAASYH